MELNRAWQLFNEEHAAILSRFTIYNYRASIRALERFGVTSTTELKRRTVAEWLTQRRRDGIAPRTINAQFAGLLSVLSFLERAGRFPLARLLRLRRLRLRRIAKGTPLYLSAQEILRLRRAAFTVARRLDLAVCIAIFAGLRMDEIRRLHREHLVLDVPLPYLRVELPTKTGKARTAPIPREFADWLLAWGLPASGPLFPRMTTHCHTPEMGRETMRAWLVLARKRAELPHATWFVLRHTFASHMRTNAVEISLISGFMGNTTAICEKSYAALAPGGHAAIEKGLASIWEAVKAPAQTA